MVFLWVRCTNMDILTLEVFYQRELVSRTKQLHQVLQQNACLKRALQRLKRHLAVTSGTRLSLAEPDLSGVQLLIAGSSQESQDDDVFHEPNVEMDDGDLAVHETTNDDLSLVEVKPQVTANDNPEGHLTLQEFLHSEVLEITVKIHEQLQQRTIVTKNFDQILQLVHNGEITRETKNKFIEISGTFGSSSEA